MVFPFTSELHDVLGPDFGMTGRLLISMPQLEEGPFSKAVVFICRHDEDHAFGMIINKPVQGLTAEEAIPCLSETDDGLISPQVFFGGPCDTQTGLILHGGDYYTQETLRVGDHFGMTATKEALHHLNDGKLSTQTSRLLAGHAGWSSGQLDDELRRHYWLDMEADPDFVFGQSPETMWDVAIDLIGISHSNLSALSADTDAGSRPLN